MYVCDLGGVKIWRPISAPIPTIIAECEYFPIFANFEDDWAAFVASMIFSNFGTIVAKRAAFPAPFTAEDPYLTAFNAPPATAVAPNVTKPATINTSETPPSIVQPPLFRAVVHSPRPIA